MMVKVKTHLFSIHIASPEFQPILFSSFIISVKKVRFQELFVCLIVCWFAGYINNLLTDFR